MIGGGYDAPPISSKYFDSRLPRHFEGLGVERINKYLRLFGLGKETGIDLPGEVEGRVPTPEWKKNYFKDPVNQKWYLGDTYNLSIGQGFILATPLQIATAFQAIANGGKIFKPKIAKEILDAEGKVKKELNPEILKENFVSKESLRIAKEGMCQAVSSPSGSAFYLSTLPVKVCAKTGTAQIYPKKEIYHNWITVFGPSENPEILLTVVIEEVKGTRIVAQKVAKQILEWYFSR
jgi:penicillin-binding protein 2